MEESKGKETEDVSEQLHLQQIEVIEIPTTDEDVLLLSEHTNTQCSETDEEHKKVEPSLGDHSYSVSAQPLDDPNVEEDVLLIPGTSHSKHPKSPRRHRKQLVSEDVSSSESGESLEEAVSNKSVITIDSTSGGDHEVSEIEENTSSNDGEPKSSSSDLSRASCVEFGLLEMLKTSVNNIIARLKANAIREKSLIDALDLIRESYNFLYIDRHDEEKSDRLYQTIHYLKAILKIPREITGFRENSSVLTQTDQESSTHLSRSEDISGPGSSRSVSTGNITTTTRVPQPRSLQTSEVADRSGLSTASSESVTINAAYEDYNPSTRTNLSLSGMLIPFSRSHAVVEHYDFIFKSVKKNTSDSNNSDIIVLRDYMVSTGLKIMKDFADFVDFLSGKVTTVLNRSDPSSKYYKKEDRLAFVNSTFTSVLTKKKSEVKTCISHIHGFCQLLTEGEDPATGCTEESIGAKFHSILEDSSSEAILVNRESRIKYYVKELCRLNYIIEGLTFSCMDTEKAILDLCCKADIEISSYPVKCFLINTKHVLANISLLCKSYFDFLLSYEDPVIPVEKILEFKVKFAKKFERLLQIKFKVNINFWYDCETRSH